MRKYRKRFYLPAAAAVLSLSMAFSSPAGTWTHTAPDGKEEELRWFYLKDDGLYAKKEWIYDSSGKRYWLDESSCLPDTWGFDPAGNLYNSAGEYVDLSGDRKYLSKEAFAQLSEDMNYSQVISIMGREHELLSYEESIDSSTLAIAWYSHDGGSYAAAVFYNGLLNDFYIN